MPFWFLFGLLNRIHWIVAGWLAVCLVYNTLNALGAHVSWTLGQVLILEHIPFFGLGILFYRLHKDKGKAGQWPGHLLIAACIAVIAMTHPAVYFGVALFCTAVFYLFIHGRLVWLQSAPFTFLGMISYSLYLVHQAVGFDIIWHVEHDVHWSSTVAIFMAMGASAILATLITFTVERPAMRWIRDQWKLRRTRTPGQHA
jgi:peptidoglycan/LPS O-acetylase OafA/YrhL